MSTYSRTLKRKVMFEDDVSKSDSENEDPDYHLPNQYQKKKKSGSSTSNRAKTVGSQPPRKRGRPPLVRAVPENSSLEEAPLENNGAPRNSPVNHQDGEPRPVRVPDEAEPNEESSAIARLEAQTKRDAARIAKLEASDAEKTQGINTLTEAVGILFDLMATMPAQRLPAGFPNLPYLANFPAAPFFLNQQFPPPQQLPDQPDHNN